MSYASLTAVSAERVAELKRQVRDGSYVVDPAAVAERMISEGSYPLLLQALDPKTKSALSKALRH